MKGKKSNSIPAFAEIKTSNVSEQLANMSERYDALSSALEKERLLRSEMVNEQAASELAALRKLHEEEVARIKAEARAEILRELSQREVEVEKRSAALDQREKELDVRREKANDLLIPKSIDYARREFERAKTENVFLSNFGLASFQIIYGVEELIKELGLTGAEIRLRIEKKMQPSPGSHCWLGVYPR